MKAGAKEANVDSGNCSTFAYGNELKCNLSKATVGFGVVIWLVPPAPPPHSSLPTPWFDAKLTTAFPAVFSSLALPSSPSTT